MASVYDLKPAFQKLLRPLCKALKKSGVTPNHVTIMAMLLSFGMGGLIYVYADAAWPLLVLPLFLFVRMALNAIDGMMAREYNMSSKLGAILNELGDVVSDTVVYLPLAVVPSIPALPIISLVILGIISEMAGVVGVQAGGTRRYDGPMGKSDRAFALGLFALLLGLDVIPRPLMPFLLWAITVLLIMTIVNRSAKVLKEHRE